MSDDPKTLVSTEWLANHLKDPDLRIFDASWYLPDMNRDARAEYEAGHIPGARLVNYKKVRAKQNIGGREVTRMTPARADFEALMQQAQLQAQAA